ncbi:MAG: DUF6600 domain-containing protein [Polyangiales bacterium]
MNLPLRIALLGSFALSVACTSSWQEEPETPRAAWEDETPPGASTAAPPYPTPQPAQTVAVQNPEDVEETDPAAMATFQPALQPYGTWVDDPVYGTVWVPDPDAVGPGFQPYVTAGHWTYTDDGYYWASDYQWGWATFHYGRWVWVDGNGWVWIPGARYSPAWVDWRYGDGYIGWGPMYPHYCWHGYSTVWINVGPTPYVFAPSHSFFHPHPSSVIVAPSAAPGLVASTHPYAPKPVVGQKPFAGPDPKSAGIPTTSMPKAPTQPNKNVAWNPAPGSKIAPNPGGGMAAMKPAPASPSYPSYPKYPSSAPGSKPMGVAPGGSKSLGSVPSYDSPAATGPKYNGPTAKPYPGGGYGGPTYKPSTPGYGGAPSYKPSAPYGGAPSYKPPTYSSPPPSYKPPGYSSPAPKAYSPPTSVHPSAPTYSSPSKPSKPTYSAPAHAGKHK